MGMPNRPAYLVDVAELVADLRGISVDELAELERANALALFQKMK
jgi:Tat protein secretion system quality control protein TatD with DNase activity